MREGKYTILMADLENNPGGLYKFLEPFYTLPSLKSGDSEIAL